MPRVEIKEIESPSLRNPVVVEGFPGVGMVGTIAASYMAEKLKMKLVGYLASNLFPPIAAIHNYVPVSPARIYASEEHDLIVIFSEFVIPAEIVYPLAQEIVKWAKAKNAKAIYSLAAIGSEQPTGNFYGISSTPEMADQLKGKGVELIREGATQGVSGMLIAECAWQKVQAANLMIQTSLPLDLQGAARLLEKLGELIKMKIDTAELIAEGERIEKRMKATLAQVQEMHRDYKEMERRKTYM
jgi:uncharacterized protein